MGVGLIIQVMRLTHFFITINHKKILLKNEEG